MHMGDQLKKTVRFYRPVIIEKDESEVDVPAGFWASSQGVVSGASAADRRVRIKGSPWFGDAGTGRTRAYLYLRSGRVRLAGEWPSVVDNAGNVVPLALTEGNLFETAYLVPFGTKERVAMVGPLRGTASRSGIEAWLSVVLGFVPQGRSLKLEPLIDEALATKVANSVGVSRLEVVVPAKTDLDFGDGPQSQVERALQSTDAAEAGELDVTMAWSYGNRRKGEKVAELLEAAKRLWQAEGIKKLEVSLMLPGEEDGTYRTETHELVEDKITVQSDFDIDDESEPNVEDMLEGMHQAIEQYQKPDQ